MKPYLVLRAMNPGYDINTDCVYVYAKDEVGNRYLIATHFPPGIRLGLPLFMPKYVPRS